MLKAATAPVGAEPPDIPGDIPRHGRHGTPWIRFPGLDYDPRDDDSRTRKPKRGTYYTRASNLGSPLEDKYLVHKARERRIVFGLSRAEHLVMAAHAVPDWPDPDAADSEELREQAKADKARLEEIADQAATLARIDAASTMGTAFHRLSELRDAGHPLAHLSPLHRAGLDAWERITACFRWVATETFVVCDELAAAGTFDRLAELLTDVTIVARDGTVLAVLPAGTRIIVDLKSGRWGPKWFGLTYLVQALPYALGVPYTHKGGRGEWPDGIAPSQEWAVIPWVNHLDPDDAGLHWINLAQARRATAALAEVKALRAADDLFLPHVEPEPVPDIPALLCDVLACAETVAELDDLWRGHADIWTDEHTLAAKRRMAELEAR